MSSEHAENQATEQRAEANYGGGIPNVLTLCLLLSTELLVDCLSYPSVRSRRQCPPAAFRPSPLVAIQRSRHRSIPCWGPPFSRREILLVPESLDRWVNFDGIRWRRVEINGMQWTVIVWLWYNCGVYECVCASARARVYASDNWTRRTGVVVVM